MGRVPKPPSRARGGSGASVCWGGGNLMEYRLRALRLPGPLSLPGAFVRDGLPLPEVLFGGPEPGSLKPFPVGFGSCAAMWGWFRCWLSSRLDACLAVVSVVLRNGPQWEIPSPSLLAGLGGWGWGLELSGSCL